MKNDIIKYCLFLSILFILLSLILFEEISFWFLGIGVSTIGFILLYIINKNQSSN